MAYVRADEGHPSLPRSAPPPAIEASPPPEQAAQPPDVPSSFTQDGDGELADPNNNADANNNLDTGSPNRNLESANTAPVASTNTQDNSVSKESVLDNTHYWFECDDDAVSMLSPKDFDSILSPNATGTPYMLFYTRVTN